jgi:hypothetical protein
MVGYHIRARAHSVEPFEWQMFMELCDRHLMKTRSS